MAQADTGPKVTYVTPDDYEIYLSSKPSGSFAPKALSAVAHAVSAHWGLIGYRIRPTGSNIYGDGWFVVAASDGARFVLSADRYGNVREIRSNGETGNAYLNGVEAEIDAEHEARSW